MHLQKEQRSRKDDVFQVTLGRPKPNQSDNVSSLYGSVKGHTPKARKQPKGLSTGASGPPKGVKRVKGMAMKGASTTQSSISLIQPGEIEQSEHIKSMKHSAKKQH